MSRLRHNVFGQALERALVRIVRNESPRAMRLRVFLESLPEYQAIRAARRDALLYGVGVAVIELAPEPRPKKRVTRRGEGH